MMENGPGTLARRTEEAREFSGRNEAPPAAKPSAPLEELTVVASHRDDAGGRHRPILEEGGLAEEVEQAPIHQEGGGQDASPQVVIRVLDRLAEVDPSIVLDRGLDVPAEARRGLILLTPKSS